MKVHKFNGGEYWYDHNLKTWVVTERDVNGNQIGEGKYSGSKIGRDLYIKAITTNVLKVSTKDIPGIIETISQKGARPISITLRTEKPLLKKNRVTGLKHNYGDHVTKIAKFNAFVNTDYENSVNSQLKREGKDPEFKSKPNWFKHSNPETRGLICLPGQSCNYLQLKVEKRLSEEFLDASGSAVQKRHILNLLPKPPQTKNQGVDKTVLTICPKLDNIMGFTCEGKEYVVIN